MVAPPMSDDVFISHHSSQYEAAKAVKAALAEHGIRGWLAPDDVDPGSAFDTQIIEQIKRSRAIVLLLSPAADQSRHVKRELMLADDEAIAVLPVRLEPLRAEGLAYFLKDRQWIDWFGAKGDGLDRLVAAVRALYAAPTEQAPRSVPAASRRRQPRWPWAVGALIVLAIAGGATWLVVAKTSGPDPVVRPGLWLNKREMIAITYPKLPAEAAQQIRETVENDPNPEECLREDVVRHPDVRLFDPGNKGKCTLSGFQIGSGQMSGYLTCPMQGAPNAVVQIVFRGRYTPTTIEVDQDVTMAQPGGTLKFKARDSSHWVAAACAAQPQ